MKQLEKLRELIRDVRPNSNVYKLVKVAHYKIEELIDEIENFKKQKEASW